MTGWLRIWAASGANPETVLVGTGCVPVHQAQCRSDCFNAQTSAPRFALSALKMTSYCFFSCFGCRLRYDACPCGFGVRQRFQKNRPHPPEPAVGNNTGTNFPSPHAIRSAGFFMSGRIPLSIGSGLQGQDYSKNSKRPLLLVPFIVTAVVSTL
jgi:membrane-associated phospholipid phosphatase